MKHLKSVSIFKISASNKTFFEGCLDCRGVLSNELYKSNEN